MFVSVFPDQFSVWICGSTKYIVPSYVGGHPPTHWGLNRTKRQRKEVFALYTSCLSAELGHLSSPALGPGFTAEIPWVLRPWEWDENYTPACLNLQLNDNRSWDFSTLIIIWVSSLSLSPYLSIYIYTHTHYLFCFSGKSLLVYQNYIVYNKIT